MSLRILFAIHGPADARTAVFLTVSKRADYLRGAGHHVDIVSPADFAVGTWSRLQPVLLPLELAARGRLRDYDVVVFHSYLAWAHAAAALGGRRRPAAIVAFHGLEPLYHAAVSGELARTGERVSGRFQLLHSTIVPKLLRLACRRADGVFCLNAQERSFLLANGWAEPARVSVLPNGVDAELLALPRCHRPLARRLLFTGQWLRAKGIGYLADAFTRIARSYPDVELTCVGTGAGSDVVFRDFDPALHGRLRVLPRVNRSELAAELARADVFLFPSLSEGFSGALLEAMASGLPVVATPAGAAPDLLQQDVTGLVVPFADAAALADAASAAAGRSASARGTRRGCTPDRDDLRMGRGERRVRGADRAGGGRHRMTDGRHTRDVYDAWHERVSGAAALDTPWHRLVQDVIDVPRDLDGRRVLEIACGRGDFAEWCASHSAPSCLVAADFSMSAVGLRAGAVSTDIAPCGSSRPMRRRLRCRRTRWIR